MSVGTLTVELRRRRLEEVLASRSRCSAASGGVAGTESTLEAARAWCTVADAYVRGVIERDFLSQVENAVVAAWYALRTQGAR